MAKITIELSDEEFKDFKESLETLSSVIREFRLQSEEERLKSEEDRNGNRQKHDEETRIFQEEMTEKREETRKF